MKNKKIFCVALLIADDGQSSAICKNECTIEELEKLKEEHNNNNIILLGWIPIQFYGGGDVDENDNNYIIFD